ncbi:hypothetical protein [Bifidobacterium aquikefiri]|uniref:hypothetical protein n=1 Tax=Bifidobacterium aquikefiri TaxID=1653207 RepID=UPI0039E843A8
MNSSLYVVAIIGSFPVRPSYPTRPKVNQHCSKPGRTRKPPRLIAGLIPTASGPMSPDMRQALTECQNLIERRAATLLDKAITAREPWTARLGPKPDEPRKQAAWLKAARTIAAYRDRYQISDNYPLGPKFRDTNVRQKIDSARGRAALTQTLRLGNLQSPTEATRPTVVVHQERGF